MTVRVRHRWIVWLLPLFLLRALVPIGFMWAPLESGSLLRLCEGLNNPVLPRLVADASTDPHAAHRAHAQYEHHAHDRTAGVDHSRHESGSHQQVCPFLLAGIGFADGSNHAVFEIPFFAGVPAATFTHEPQDQGPVVLIRIRGPPNLPA
jgi:hypothetical protein